MKYTPLNLPIIEPATDPIRSESGDNLWKQLNALAASTDTAITQEGARAEEAAMAGAVEDAATKYGSVDRYMLPPALGSTEDLNTVTTPGRRRQNQSSVAGKAELHYPPGATHGFLDTVSMDGTAGKYISHTWVDTWGLWSASRRLYNGTWTAWERHGEVGTGALTTRVASLESSVARISVQPGSALVYGPNRPDAWAYPSGTTIFWTRPEGTEAVSTSYKGDGYVGKLGAVTGYTTMRVTKAEANGTVDVSCINPSTSRHVTYRLQGTKNATWLDDMQIIEEIWTGAVVGGVPSMDTLVSPRSNMEYAFQIDINGSATFVPHHGSATAVDAGGTRGLFRISGAPIDVDTLAVGASITGLNGVKLRQSIYGRHPDSGTTDWVRVDQVTTISPDGMVQSETRWEALRDVKLGTNYGPMTPLLMGTVDTVHVQDGAAYPLDAVAPATTRYDNVTEGRGAVSMLATSSTSPTFAAVSILDPKETFLLGHPLSSTTTPTRIEQRNNGWVKIYPSGFATGAVVPKGTVWRMGAQWRFGEAANARQYV